MLLAQAITAHPSQVRADLQRYYGLNLDRMGEDFGAFQAAACVANLPLGSALLAKVDRRYSWTTTDYLVHGLMCAVAGKEIPYPWEEKESGIDGLDTESLPLDQFIDWYTNTDFKEVEEWHRVL